MSAEILQQAFASTGGVLAHLSPDQLDRPTPCASWTVRELVNHIVGGTTFFAITAETGAAPVRGTGPDYTAGDVVGAFDEGARRAVEAFAPEGAMEKTMKLPYGELPGSVFVQIAAIDTFTHGWDLAKAIGLSTDLAPAVAAQLREAAQALLPEAMRGPGRPSPVRTDRRSARRCAGSRQAGWVHGSTTLIASAADEVDWVPWGSGGNARAKVLGAADGFNVALVEADAGYAGDPHVHTYPEFLYVVDGTGRRARDPRGARPRRAVLCKPATVLTSRVATRPGRVCAALDQPRVSNRGAFAA